MHRRVFALSFGCLVAASSSISIAQPQEFGPPGGPPGQGGPTGGMMPPSPLMTALDADMDGVLSKKEISNATAALNKLDKDNDGTVSMGELRPDFSGPRNGPNGEEVGGRGRNNESGRNGRPSDVNKGGPGPGGPGGPGMPGGFGGPGGGPGGFGPPNPEEFVDRAFQFDADGDGKLSKEELSKMFQGNARGGPGNRSGRQRSR